MLRLRRAVRLAAITVVATVGLAGMAVSADAYFRRPPSDVNPAIMQIDEKAVLGAQLDGETPLVDSNGREFRWKDMLGKPLILVLAYYTCDGACSIINSSLRDDLAGVRLVKPGEDFRILTLSFDRHDNLQTTDAFRNHLELAGDLRNNWKFATFKNEADLKSQTEKIGFKFFWSPADRIFLHPGAFLFFSPEGRLIRVLYQGGVDSRDVELAVLDAKQTHYRPSEIVNLAVSLCYSYNYHDGKYALSIPVIVGVGSFLAGVMTLIISLLVFRRGARKRAQGGIKHAHTA
jgi:protein SCO1/2